MDAGLLAQYAVIALAVLASAVVVMRKQFPNATRRLRIAIALPLMREGSPAWMKSRRCMGVSPGARKVEIM